MNYDVISVHPLNSWQFLVLIQDEIGDTQTMIGHVGYTDGDDQKLLLRPLPIVVKAE